MGVEPRIIHLPPRHEVQHAHSSHDKIARVFGDRATTPLDDGFASMADWVKRPGARSSPAFDGIEITKNLPEA